MNDRKFFTIFIVCLSILIGIIGIISYLEDPAKIFHSDYEQKMVDIINSGKNVANVENYDERLFNKYLIYQYPENVDVSVIGSSRIMQIRDSFLPYNLTLLNNGVSGASIEDEIALIWIYHQKGNLPNHIIIGVDPWIFNKNNNQNRWMSLKEEYECGIDILQLDNRDSNLYSFLIKKIWYDVKKYLSLISRDVLISSLNNIFLRTIQGNNFEMYPTNEVFSDVGIRLTDGSISYPEKVRNRDIEEVNKMASDYISGPIYSLNSFDEIDNANKNKFMRLIDFLHKEKVQITIVLPPYHPIVYDEIKKNTKYRNVLLVEEFLKDFSLGKNISIVGSYDPLNMNLTSNDFFDGMHLNLQGVDKLRNNLFPAVFT